MDIKGKVIVITGGSQGLGKALAQEFVAEQCHLVIASNNKTNLESTAKELGIDYFHTDVTLFEQTQNLGDFVAKKFVTIDFWINNAGIQIAPSVTEDVDIKKLQNLFAINFFGYFYGCQTALRYMKKQGYGTILNINSTAGLEGKPNLSAYVSSKFAIKGLTESIRKELVGSDIQVYGVFPGGIQTEIYKEQYPKDFHDYMRVEDVAKRIVNNFKSDVPELDFVIKRPRKVK